MPVAITVILAIIDGGFKLLQQHLGKPEGWKPSEEDWDDLTAEIDASTPEAERAAARARLGLPPI